MANDSGELTEFEIWWDLDSSFDDRVTLIKRWHDMVMTDSGYQTPEMVANLPSTDLEETLVSDLSQDEIFE